MFIIENEVYSMCSSFTGTIKKNFQTLCSVRYRLECILMVHYYLEHTETNIQH